CCLWGTPEVLRPAPPLDNGQTGFPQSHVPILESSMQQDTCVAWAELTTRVHSRNDVLHCFLWVISFPSALEAACSMWRSGGSDLGPRVVSLDI
ncbi:hypothetical protein EK904_006405, partial [Melospiza melodia maxima]